VQRFTVAFNFLCVLLGLLHEGSHLSLSVRRKITVNVFLFNVYKRFLFWGERFFIYGSLHWHRESATSALAAHGRPPC